MTVHPRPAALPPHSPPAASPPSIEVECLTLSYGPLTVLEDVTLTMGSGSVTAVIGPSGCGKTSFLCGLNRLTDLLPGCRVQGRIAIGPVDVRAAATDVIALRRRVGMIFQRPNPFPLSIRGNLELPLREHGLTARAARHQRIEEVLRDVGLWDEVKDRLGASALSLSIGQQQRLCIARALALKPEALLMDEPCSALDPLSTEVIEQLIHGLRGRLTVVVVTHNLGQARRIADDAAFFWVADGRGRLVEFGPCEELFAAPRDPLTAAFVSGRAG